MCVQRTNLVLDKANFAALRKLPEITVPNLTADNYDIFTAALCYLIWITIAMNSMPIDYVVCLSVGTASKIPKLIHYRVVLFHTPNSGMIDL